MNEDKPRNPAIGDLLDLSDAQMDKLKKRLKRDYEDWKQNTSELHDDLKRWNDLVENVVEETDYPFEGCSNVHVGIIAIFMKVYHSILRRSVLAADMIWMLDTDNEELDEFVQDIEEAINFKARAKWNIAEALSDVIWTTCRDKLGILHVPYVEEVEENVKDVVYVHNLQEFLGEFPPDDSGLSGQEWQAWAERVKLEATDETPVEIPIVYDKVEYQGPKGEIVELADFVIFPATARSINKSDCHGFGHRFYMRREQVREKKLSGVWYEDSVNDFLSKTRSGSTVSDYMQSKDQIEGLSRSSKTDDYEFVSLVYRIRWKNDEPEQKLLLVYAPEKEIVMSVMDFPYRIDHYALFRIEKKANRLLGGNIPGDLDDSNEEIDALHNQRLNSRKITEVPSFKAKKNANKDFDPQADENKWRPGVVFWLDDPDAFTQFTVQPVDLGTSMAEEANDLKISSLQMGVEPFLASGSASPDNPDAPGNKTQSLIQQFNLRMDDPLSEIRNGVEAVGQICLSHEYQFGPAQISYTKDAGNGRRETQSFPKRLLRTGVTLKMFGVTVRLNPEAEFQKWFGYYAALTRDPIIAKRDPSRWELLMRMMKNGRVEGREKILPSLEELHQEQIEVQKQALMQMAQEQQAAKAQAMQEQKKQMIQGLSEKLKVKRTVEGLAKPPSMNGNGAMVPVNVA